MLYLDISKGRIDMADSICKALDCNNKLANKRAKYCSDKCRMADNRRKTIVMPEENETENPIVVDVPKDTVFEFYVRKEKSSDTYKGVKVLKELRKAKTWTDVPLGAVPILKEGFPPMPEYMNGRQYFLWWKNDFKEKDGKKVIFNPMPVYDRIEYFQAGEQSRRWGA